MLLRFRQRQFVDRSVKALKEHGNTLGVAPTGCHAPGTPILMFDGTIKNVEEVVVNDQIMGPDSKPRSVLKLHQGFDEMVEIRPIKGKSFIVTHDHILSLVRTNRTVAEAEGNKPTYVNISVNEFLQKGISFRSDHKLYRTKIDFHQTSDFPIDPYFLGVLLGDGCLRNGVSITTSDPEIAAYCQKMADEWGVRLRIEQTSYSEANGYFFVKKEINNRLKNPLTECLRSLGVHGKGAAEKYIPFQYKTANNKVRAAILAGLLDTDGYKIKTIMEFTTASKRLADDVAFIARSLGFQALPRIRVVNGTNYYRFCLCGDFSEIPLKIGRKIPGKRKQKKDPLRTGFSIHPVGKGDYYGFTVDKDQLYVMGDFTVTHNCGKSIMLASVTGKILDRNDSKACILAHRDELTAQNEQKFKWVNPGLETSIVDAKRKSWDGQAVFAMAQTLSGKDQLARIPSLDLLVIDEAHHAVARTYQNIIKTVKARNPNCMIYGLTATPVRGDKKGLSVIFNNVADHVTLAELVQSGHLVPPRSFVIDIGTQEELKQIRRNASDFDMMQVESIMDKQPLNEEVVRHWQEKAGNRKTIVFCSTVSHAEHVAGAFRDAGISTAVIDSNLSKAERHDLLKRFDQGDLQVLVNCFVLTEGFDSQPVSCIVLLRPASYKSTFIQCIGRGLRTVDPNQYPGVVKEDCIVLDFGTSTLIHGSLDQEVTLDPPKGKAPQKTCPECQAIIPISSPQCDLCGYEWPKVMGETKEKEDEKSTISDFVLSEIDLLERSSFKWCDLFGDDMALMALGFHAWGGAFCWKHIWYGLGGGKEQPTTLLAIGERSVCLAAADDWLNTYETSESAHKSKRWLSQLATDKQRQFLPHFQNDYGLTKYHASALINFTFNKQQIHDLVFHSYREVA